MLIKMSLNLEQKTHSVPKKIRISVSFTIGDNHVSDSATDIHLFIYGLEFFDLII